MSTSTVTPEVAAFAQGVRDALADLPSEEIEDLTEGLEADLAESLAEDLRRTLPDPTAYAEELRLAAGLPGRTNVAKHGMLSGLADGWRDTRADISVAIRRNPMLSKPLELIGELRPAWWILRALIAFMSVRFLMGDRGDMLPNDLPDVLVLLPCLLVSIQWGRGRWHLPHGMFAVLLVGNVIAAALAVPLLTNALERETIYVGTESATEPQDLTGVYLNGTPVTNIFGFGADGKPLKDLQLFDQDGNPLARAVAGADGCLDPQCDKNGIWVPSTLRNGTVAHNVFPMRMVEATYGDDGSTLRAVPGTAPQDRAVPFKRVPALVTPEKVAKSNQ